MGIGYTLPIMTDKEKGGDKVTTKTQQNDNKSTAKKP